MWNHRCTVTAAALVAMVGATAGCGSHDDTTQASASSSAVAATSPATADPISGPYNGFREVVATGTDVVPADVPAEVGAGFVRLKATGCREGTIAVGDRLATCGADGTTAMIIGAEVVPGAQVASAQITPDSTGESDVVSVTLTTAGSAAMSAYTSAHIGSAIAVVKGTQVCTAPVISQAIATGQIQLTTSRTDQTVDNLAECVRA